jgi:hypothetical protein
VERQPYASFAVMKGCLKALSNAIETCLRRLEFHHHMALPARALEMVPQIHRSLRALLAMCYRPASSCFAPHAGKTFVSALAVTSVSAPLSKSVSNTARLVLDKLNATCRLAS